MATSAPHTGTRKRFWFDPRFVIGFILVIASVAGVYAIVSAANRSSQVYAARGPLVAGASINAGDLVVRSVRLGAADRLYVKSGELPSGGIVLARSVAAGELVPLTAVASADADRQTSVVVQVKGELAASVAPGTAVDVWSARQADQNRYAPPAVLGGAATVVRLIESDTLVAGRDGLSVEVRVPNKKVAAVLEAIANADVISLVPASASEPGTGHTQRPETGAQG